MWNTSNIRRRLCASTAALFLLLTALGMMCLAAELAYMLTGGSIQTLAAAVGMALCAALLLLALGKKYDAPAARSTEAATPRRDSERPRSSQMELKAARGVSATSYLDTASMAERTQSANRAN